jgi:hypothetical protein
MASDREKNEGGLAAIKPAGDNYKKRITEFTACSRVENPSGNASLGSRAQIVNSASLLYSYKKKKKKKNNA